MTWRSTRCDRRPPSTSIPCFKELTLADRQMCIISSELIVVAPCWCTRGEHYLSKDHIAFAGHEGV